MIGRTLFRIILIVVVGYLFWRFILRHTTSQSIDTPQVDGGTLKVKVVRSGRYYFGSGHWGYGGGDDRVRNMLWWDAHYPPRGPRVWFHQPRKLQKVGDYSGKTSHLVTKIRTSYLVEE